MLASSMWGSTVNRTITTTHCNRHRNKKNSKSFAAFWCFLLYGSKWEIRRMNLKKKKSSTTSNVLEVENNCCQTVCFIIKKKCILLNTINIQCKFCSSIIFYLLVFSCTQGSLGLFDGTWLRCQRTEGGPVGFCSDCTKRFKTPLAVI